MKITRKQIRKIIKESFDKYGMSEYGLYDKPGATEAKAELDALLDKVVESALTVSMSDPRSAAAEGTPAKNHTLTIEYKQRQWWSSFLEAGTQNPRYKQHIGLGHAINTVSDALKKATGKYLPSGFHDKLYKAAESAGRVRAEKVGNRWRITK